MIEQFESKLDNSLMIIISEEKSIASFKELVQRATNLWPDAPSEIKEFADLVTHGKVLQNYKAQEKGARPAPRT